MDEKNELANSGEFTAIYAAFQPKIYRYLARLVGKQVAEDLTQEVFVKVGKALSTFHNESQLSTWIYRIATNTAIDRMRNPAFQQETAWDPEVCSVRAGVSTVGGENASLLQKKKFAGRPSDSRGDERMYPGGDSTPTRELPDSCYS